MKLCALFEQPSRTPTSVDYEQEYKDVDGQWAYRFVTIEGDCVSDTNSYGTNHSPSTSTFEPERVFVRDTGEQLDLYTFLKHLNRKSYQWIVNKACENAH